MIELPENFDSIFRYIVVVSQRAEQIINGAKIRSETRHEKPTLGAKDDVDFGLVEWRILTQEELDAQRQAIVDQFRAQVSSEQEEGAPIPDVLPTAATLADGPVVEGEPKEGDDELSRLQRLLGMAGGQGEGEAAEPGTEDLETEADAEAEGEAEGEGEGEDFTLDLDDAEELPDESGGDEEEEDE